MNTDTMTIMHEQRETRCLVWIEPASTSTNSKIPQPPSIGLMTLSTKNIKA